MRVLTPNLILVLLWLLCTVAMVTVHGCYGYSVRLLWLQCTVAMVTVYGCYGYSVRLLWL